MPYNDRHGIGRSFIGAATRRLGPKCCAFFLFFGLSPWITTAAYARPVSEQALALDDSDMGRAPGQVGASTGGVGASSRGSEGGSEQTATQQAADAQVSADDREERFWIGGQLGVAFASQDIEDNDDFTANGVQLAALFAWTVRDFLQARAEIGARFVSGTSDSGDNACSRADGKKCQISSNMGWLQGGLQVRLPIPYVAPFVEVGVMLAGGVFKTRTSEVEHKVFTAPAILVPVKLGVALGQEHGVEIALQVFDHPPANQFLGSLSIAVLLRP